MGKLFNHGVAPSEIENMDYGDLEYWSEWIDLINQTKLDAIEDARGNP